MRTFFKLLPRLINQWGVGFCVLCFAGLVFGLLGLAMIIIMAYVLVTT